MHLAKLCCCVNLSVFNRVCEFLRGKECSSVKAPWVRTRSRFISERCDRHQAANTENKMIMIEFLFMCARFVSVNFKHVVVV